MKTRICLFMTAAVIICFAVTTHAAVLPQGDVNGNNSVDITDALKTLRIVVQLDVPTASELLQADVAPLSNGLPAPDGKVDITTRCSASKRLCNSRHGRWVMSRLYLKMATQTF